MDKRQVVWCIIAVLLLLAVGGLVRYAQLQPLPVEPRATTLAPVISAAVLVRLDTGDPTPQVVPGQVVIYYAPTWPPPTWPPPTVTPTPTSWLQASRNVVAVVTARAGADIYKQMSNYADPDHIGGVCLLEGRPAAHLAAGEYVLVTNIWGLLAEVRYGEGWQAQGWVKARELCSHPWCQPVR